MAVRISTITMNRLQGHVNLSAAEILMLAAILVAPLRAYIFTQIIGFNLSAFRMLWTLTLFALALKVLHARGQVQVPRPKDLRGIFFPLLFLSIALLTSVSVSSDPGQSEVKTRLFVKMFGFLAIILIFALFFSKPINIERALIMYIISSLTPMMIGSYQLFFFLLRGYFPSLPFAQLTVINDPEAPEFGLMYFLLPRLTSTFLEPNYYGQFLTISILISLPLFLASLTDAHITASVQKMVLFLISVLGIFQLVYTFSLSSFVGFAVGLATMILWTKRLKLFKLIKGVTLMIGILALGNLIIANFIPSTLVPTTAVGERIRLKIATSGDFLLDRRPYFEGVGEAFSKSPIVGVGFGGLVTYTGAEVPSGHNAFLTFLAEQGLVGFLPLMVFFVYLFYGVYSRTVRLFEIGEERLAILGVGIFLSLVAIVAANQFYDMMFSFDSSWLLIAIACGYGLMPVEKTVHDKNEK